MTKKNITITALAAMLILSMSALAFAGPGYGRGGCGGPGSGYGQGAYSQLTPEKQAEVQAIYDKYDPQFTKLRDAMWTKLAVLQAMINDGDSNEKKIGKLTTELSSLRDQMRDLRVAMSDEVSQVTGIESWRGRGYACNGNGPANCPGYGRGGQGRGHGMGSRW